MIAVIVVVVVEVKVLVWSTSIIDTVLTVEVLVVDAEIILVGFIALPISYSVDVPSGVAADLFMDSLPGLMLVGLAGIGIVVLTGVNSNAWAVVMTILEFPVPTPLKESSR